MNGNGTGFAGNHLGVNLAYTKFFFVTPGRDDESTRNVLAHLTLACGRLAVGLGAPLPPPRPTGPAGRGGRWEPWPRA